MGIVMRHEARQVPSWLIFDVRQIYERVRRFKGKFVDELSCTKPSDMKFEDMLVKARMNSGTSDLKLLPREKERLKQLYFEASVRELGERGRKRSR